MHGGFTLIFNNVFYVLSLQRKLISMSLLEDDGFECLFAHRQDILSLNDFRVMNMCDVTNKCKRSNSDK
jgi:hypothetical protein